jgi:single-strand DNA-binding protein
MNYNKTIFAGRLTRDPELRQTQSGVSSMNTAIAGNRIFLSKDGQKQEDTTFLEIRAYGRLAENISKYFKKGSAIFVEGFLKNENWTTKTGEAKSKLVLVVESFEFVEKSTSASASKPDAVKNDTDFSEETPF